MRWEAVNMIGLLAFHTAKCCGSWAQISRFSFAHGADFTLFKQVFQPYGQGLPNEEHHDRWNSGGYSCHHLMCDSLHIQLASRPILLRPVFIMRFGHNVCVVHTHYQVVKEDPPPPFPGSVPDEIIGYHLVTKVHTAHEPLVVTNFGITLSCCSVPWFCHLLIDPRSLWVMKVWHDTDRLRILPVYKRIVHHAGQFLTHVFGEAFCFSLGHFLLADLFCWCGVCHKPEFQGFVILQKGHTREIVITVHLSLCAVKRHTHVHDNTVAQALFGVLLLLSSVHRNV